MTSISLALRKPELDMTVEMGAAVHLRQLTGPKGLPVDRPWSWSGAVPAGASGTRRVGVRHPGFYEAELILPSGRVLNEQFEIAEGQDLEFLFEEERLQERPLAKVRHRLPSADDSPEGFLLGGAAGSRLRRKRDPVGPVISTASEGSERSEEVREEEREVSVVAGFGRDPDLSIWEALGQLPARLDAEEILHAVGGVRSLPVVGTQGEGSATWRVSANVGGTDGRAYAVSKNSGGTELAVLPMPWKSGAADGYAEIEIVVDRRRRIHGFRTRVAIREHRVGGLVAYLSGGNMHAARTVLDDLVSSRLLPALPGEPLAIAAAGYVTLATGRTGIEDLSEEPFRELMGRHKWLPDGAILFARHKLRYARHLDDIEVARSALRTAYARGLPFFSAGIESLSDALSLAASGDGELEAMARNVSFARARIDPGQAFTVVRLE